MKTKRILLIGGAGFVGHHLAIRLRQLNYSVEIMDNLGVNNISHHVADNATYSSDAILLPILYQRLELLKKNKIPIHIGNASDIYSLKGVLTEVKPQIIIFLAAISHATYSNEKPQLAFENNLQSFHNVLACTKDSIDQIIYFSSSMVYGDFKSDIVDENTECKPKGVYGHFKLMGEHLCNLYQQQFGLNYTIIRPSALYGRRCVSRRVSQLFIEKAIKEEPLVIEGDGNTSLDFTYIEDLVEGVTLTIGNPKALNSTFNLTYGSARKLNDLIQILREYFPTLQVNYADHSASYVKRGTLSIEKARSVLGYKPKNDISIGYRKYIDWCQENTHLIRQNELV